MAHYSTGSTIVDQTLDFIQKTWGIDPGQARVNGWADDIKGTGTNPRSGEQLRLDILKYVVGRARIEEWVRSQFLARGATIATGSETEAQRVSRIASEIMGGQRTFSSTTQTLNDLYGPPETSGQTTTPPASPDVTEPDVAAPEPAPADEVPPPAEPDESTTDTAPRDFAHEAELLYPYLPPELRDIFVEAWIKYGDANLALAEMRASATYLQYYPGIKRSDGSLRMTELEYAATLDAFDEILLSVGVNPDLFQPRYVELIEGDVQIEEFAQRVNQIHQRVLMADPTTKAAMAEQLGIELDDTAFLVAALDPDIGQQVFNQQLDLGEIRAEASRQGFRINTESAGLLLAGFGRQGVQMARPFFTQAGQQLPALQGLASRFDTEDPTFELEEFAQGQLFGEAAQRRRITRLLSQSAAQFTVGGGIGAVRSGQTGAISGLSPR